MNNEVRVRFAPSPTGALHIGGVRTALYNYLFAKQSKGKMVLRIEDTDQARFVDGAETYILESLEWCGIIPDESPIHGGDFGPYRQSERKALYRQYADQLIREGKAYYAFDTPEELDQMRERLKAAKVATPQYNGVTRMQMSNSLTLSTSDVEEKLANNEPYVIRLKVPNKEDIRLNDLIRGWVKVHSTAIDDKVLMKSDGMPTYHLANVVDDHLMKISHVIRGEEWLPSAPLHVLLYQFLGWEESMPKFAHLPLLLKPDGNGKLSKRDGDRLGFPVFPIDGHFPGKNGEMEKYSGFREAGYLPEALMNFVAFLGWNPGSEQELFTADELTKDFSFDRINKGGAKFDIDKANWYNQQYIRKEPDSALAEIVVKAAKDEGLDYHEKKAERIASLFKERITFLNDLRQHSRIFFFAPETYDSKVVKKRWSADVVHALQDYSSVLKDRVEVSASEAKSLLEQILEKLSINMGGVMQALRLSLSGLGGGPDLMEVISILGPREVSSRIDLATDRLKDQVKS